MFCDRCGTELQPGQRFCGSCGKPVGVAVVPPAPSGRVARHLHLLAVLWFAASAINLIGAVAVFIVANTLFGHSIRFENAWPMQGFLQTLLSSVAGLLFLKALAGFAAAWGLLERQPWARVLTLVLGFVSLIHIPFGTALGIYTIWVLLPAQADEEYRRLAQAA
ncbi:MAG: hypothetical protein DMG29_10885 [Acidobacteria bacterium]|jgi:zinc-ribbon domain|nr:MAG: hypothetical protein DMG29_10885 [Acidobacteriota bacterium]